MTEKKEIFREEQDVIKETDIIFDCTHCNKSLAIDYRGAGLTIQCSDCGEDVEVPIPEGMELMDIDSSDEEQEIRILNLRRSLSLAERKIDHLQSELEELGQRREILEKTRTDGLFVYGKVAEQLDHIDTCMVDVAKAVRAIKDIMKTEKSL